MSRLLLTVTLLLVAPLAQGSAEEDPRSRVVVDSDCRTETSRRQLTLFANGTLRLWDGSGATRTMRLAELGASELEAYVNRLAAVRFDDLAPHSQGLEGEWVESCRLELALPGHETKRFEYGRFDTLPHHLKHILLVLDDLQAEVEEARETTARARGYTPEIGDIVVRRRDGARFEVRGFTLEGSGVELQGIDQPLTVFILEDEILDEYDPPAGGEKR